MCVSTNTPSLPQAADSEQSPPQNPGPATPLPWFLHYLTYETADGPARRPIALMGHEQYAQDLTHLVTRVVMFSGLIRPEDADYLLVAVNCHSDLLEACKALLAYHDDPESDDETDFLARCKMAEKAIAKAERKP